MKKLILIMLILCGCSDNINDPVDKQPTIKVFDRFVLSHVNTPSGYPNLTLIRDNETEKEFLFLDSGGSAGCVILVR